MRTTLSICIAVACAASVSSAARASTVTLAGSALPSSMGTFSALGAFISQTTSVDAPSAVDFGSGTTGAGYQMSPASDGVAFDGAFASAVSAKVIPTLSGITSNTGGGRRVPIVSEPVPRDPNSPAVAPLPIAVWAGGALLAGIATKRGRSA